MVTIELKERVGGSLVTHLASAVVESVTGCVAPSLWDVCPSSDTNSYLNHFWDLGSVMGKIVHLSLPSMRL